MYKKVILFVSIGVIAWGYCDKVDAALSPPDEPTTEERLKDSKNLKEEEDASKKKESEEAQVADDQELPKGEGKADDTIKQVTQQIIDEIYRDYGIKVHLAEGMIPGTSHIGEALSDDKALSMVSKLQEDLSVYKPDFLANKAKIKDIYLTDNLQYNTSYNSEDSPATYRPVNAFSNTKNESMALTFQNDYEPFYAHTLDHEIGHFVYKNNYSQFSQSEWTNVTEGEYRDSYFPKGWIESDPVITSSFDGYIKEEMAQDMGFKNNYGTSNDSEDFATMTERVMDRVRSGSTVYSGDGSNLDTKTKIHYDFYSNLDAFNPNYKPTDQNIDWRNHLQKDLREKYPAVNYRR